MKLEVETETRIKQKRKTKKIKTPKGTIEIKHFKLKTKKIRKRKYKCSYCEEVSTTQKEHNDHMRSKHPNNKFVCFQCNSSFDCDVSLYRHERSHYNLPYGCSVCEKRFQFPYQIKSHMKTHTRKNSELIPCLHCKRKFVTNANMLQHAKTHNEKFYCDYKNCPTPDKAYNSKGNLSQHIRGLHGKGWIAPCGDVFKWKGKYHRHLNKCDKCDDLRKKTKKERYHFL